MIVNTKTKLEYEKILEILEGYTVTYKGKLLATNLEPKFNKKEVSFLLNTTLEACNMLISNGIPTLYESEDISSILKSLEANSVLSCSSLLILCNIFKQANELKNYFSAPHILAESYPNLSILFSSLYFNTSITQEISFKILDENTLSDDSSTELKQIRTKIRNLESKIKDTLSTFLHSPKYSKCIQESIITIRNNRFVIPVKEPNKNDIRGFVHDVSNAGSTLFIEPISIFEMNNELHELKLQEELEIEQILIYLSSLFFPYFEEIQNNINIIGEIDFIFAKAKYSKAINGITPKINIEKQLHLINAKHPLLNINTSVPITVKIGESFNTLLITGPNTGGKTVTLKTIGLLSLMAQSGLNIPCDENSSIFIFDNIFADIGDEQSIQDSLSTFSSHILNISKILSKTTENSLVLLDELGSGTDPLEGSNLAISILEYIKNISPILIVTTHYPELKKYAMLNSDIENSSVEFDINTLTPTYRLLIGVPGKSNAFEISSKLGLCPSIIENAKNLMASNDIHFEEILKCIYDDKVIVENEKEKISNYSKQIDILKKQLEDEKRIFEDERTLLLNNAKIKAREILHNAKNDANTIIKEMENISDAKQLNALRNNLNDKISDLDINLNINSKTKTNVNPINIDLIKPGKKVFIKSFNAEGCILTNISKSNEVQVLIGSIKTTCKISDLEEVTNSKNSNLTTKSPLSTFSKSKTVSSQLNLIGLYPEEALYTLDKFLDDCLLSHLSSTTIIHGKGNGVLKQKVHTFLKHHRNVDSFRLGGFGEGSGGATIVYFK